MNYSNNSDDEFVEKISLDELYERKNEVEQHRVQIFNKILGRVHKKIKMTSRQKHDEQFVFFIVPEVMIGVPRYDVDTCTSYIIEKLQDNGFLVKYTHPNLLFISWKHYIPAHERQKIKRETGKKIDGFGNVIKNKDDEGNETKLLLNSSSTSSSNKKVNDDSKNYKNINNYKPTGIYNMNLISGLKKIE